jgi:CubicO group peptidase (beta-lactamase class C family)
MLRLLLRTLLALAAIGLHAARAEAPALDRARVEAFVDGAVREAMRSRRIAGVSVAIVDRSGAVMTRGYGVEALSPRRAADADTLFRVGSISKTPIWISLMQLVEQGKISLNDPINDHLPEALRIPDEGFREPIRIRHLMTHSAGFEDSALGGLFVRDPRRLLPLDEYLRTHRVHRVREPGTLAVYSNYGAALAGALVAHVAGEPWQDYAEKHVLRPLGMTAATYREPYSAALAQAQGLVDPMTEAVASEVTLGFSRAAGAFKTHAFEYVSDIAPAGAMSASANDMALYMQALLDPLLMEKAGVLRAETALAMREGLFGNTLELGAWRHGFMDYTFVRGRRAFGHDGDVVYQHSSMQIFPDEGLAIFVSVNSPNGRPLLDSLISAFLDEFAGPPAPQPPRAANAQAEAAKVAGTYRSLRLPTYRSERFILSYAASFEVAALPNGDITVGAGQARYHPVGDGLFVRNEDQGRIAFHEANGRMRLYDAESLAPSERIGFFEGMAWPKLIAALAGLAIVWSIVAAIRRMILGQRQDRAASYVLDGLCLAWLAAFVLFYLAVRPWLADDSSALFDYPGKLFPLACSAMFAAAVATPLAAALAFGPLRPKGWGWWRWTREGATLAILVCLALTLYNWGVLGYTGW